MEQEYGKQKRWLINRLTLGSGVVDGLSVAGYTPTELPSRHRTRTSRLRRSRSLTASTLAPSTGAAFVPRIYSQATLLEIISCLVSKIDDRLSEIPAPSGGRP